MHEVYKNLFGEEERKCLCKLCTYSSKVNGIIDRKNTDELIATINELMNTNYNIGADLNYNEAILDGSWPSAVKQLELALEKAKIHPNRKYDNE